MAGRPIEARLPDHRQRPTEGRDGSAATAGAFRGRSRSISSRRWSTGAEVVTLCNSGSLFGDARLVVVTEVDGRRRRTTDRRPAAGRRPIVEAVAAYLASPAPGHDVLGVVGLEMKKDAAIAKACAKAGDVLLYDVAKRERWLGRGALPAGGVTAEAGACLALVQLVGEEDLQALANEIDKMVTWAQGEPVGEPRSSNSSPGLPRPRRSPSPTRGRNETRAGARGDRDDFDRSGKPRRDTASRLAGSLGGHL